MLKRWSFVVLISLTGCFDSSEALQEVEEVPLVAPPECPKAAEDQVAVRATYLEELYPTSGEDSAIACKWTSPNCTDRFTHLGALPDGAVPPLAGCKSGANPIAACYNGAVKVTLTALNIGDAAMLYEGAVRARDITIRAGSDNNAPAWLKNFGAANLLAKLFISNAVPINTALPACATGTADQRYLCLSNASRSQFRGLLAMLDQHNGVLVRSGNMIGASERAWKIVESATAPVHARMVNTGRVSPLAGVRMNRIDLLGKYSVLRLLDGTAKEGGETELAHLVTRPTYLPGNPGAASALFVPRFDIMLAASASLRWDETQHKPIEKDAVGAADVRALWRMISHGITLSSLQGRCTLSQEFQDLRFAAASLFSSMQFERMPVEGVLTSNLINWDDRYVELLTALDVSQGRACGWITSEDYVHAWSTISYWNEYDTWEDCEEGSTTNDGGVVTNCHTCEEGEEIDGVACECHLETTCLRHGLFGGCTMEYSWSDCQYIVEIQYSEEDSGVRTIADAYTFVTSLRGAYRDVMTYNDSFEKVGDEYVKRQRGQGDGVYDLHYNPLAENDATIALSYVDGEQCLEELGDIEAAFGSTGPLTCAPGDICGTNHGALWPAGSWIPFPIATRLCPKTAGKFSGVLADDGSDSWCSTPWDFTKAVVDDWLPNSENVIEAIAEQDALDGMIYGNGTWLAEDGENLTSTLVEFFAEENLLATPIGAAYLRKAQVAYSAGRLPNLASSESLTSATLGLDNIEANVDTGLEVMRLNFGLMLDFHELEDDVGASTLDIYYDKPIPKLALSAMEEVFGGTVTNDYTSNRAMIYPRIGDALELYRELARLKLDVLWRRADGFNACIDTGVCDPTAATGCAEYCSKYEDAIAFTESSSGELDAVDDMLASHALWMSTECPFPAAAQLRTVVGGVQTCSFDDPGDLKGYIGRLREHITGTQDELARAAASIRAGNDVFGFRGMNHYPGDDIEGRIDELVASVRDMGREYEGFIDDYLATLSDHADFAAAVSSAATNTSGLVAGFCVDELGDPQAGGCATDKSTWTTTNPLIADINKSISDTLCTNQLVDRDTGATLSFTLDHIDDNGYTELAGLYEDFMTSLGLTTSACPALIAPDFAAWEGYGGALAEDLHAMEAILQQLAAQLARFRTELFAQKTMAEAIHVITTGVDGATDEAAGAQVAIAGLACLGTIIASVATEGATAIPAVGACTGFIASIGGAVSSDSIEQLHLELDTLYAGYSNLQNLMAIIFDIYSTLQQYDAAVKSFDAHRAQFLNVQVNIEADYQSLYENAFKLDPTNLLFADEQVASMALRFKSAMRDVRELEILVGYDLGAPITEGRGIYIKNDYYYLPRLADITVAEHYGAANSTAYLTLQGATRPTDERDVTLVAVATLLDAIHEAARTLSGSAHTTHGFLSEPNASGFDASGYPESYTEWSLLRRSPFYNAWIASDPSGDDNGDGISGTACSAGQVDLYRYCKKANGTPKGPENNCLAVSTLDEKTRLNLAWADHQIVGIGAVAFTCTQTATGWTITPAVGVNGVYQNIEELNPRETRDGAADFDWYLPDFMETGTVTGVGGDKWYRGHISREFYNSQTPTVQLLIDEVLDMADRGVVTITVKTFMPGSYLFGLHASDSENPNAIYDPVINDFDLEGWGLTGSTSASESFAERLQDITVLCTDGDTCEGEDRDGSNAVESHYARFFYSGPGYQSTICTGAANQDKAAWMIDDRTTQGSFAIKSSNSNLHVADAEWMSSRVTDPAASIKAGDLAEVPLQATLAVIQVFGLVDSDGVAVTNPWVLYADIEADDVPNLRVALHYRYYATQLSTNAEWSETEGQSFYESVTTCGPNSTYPW